MAGNAAGTMPPEYVGGIGADGAEALKQFVDAGGTLVALDSASELATSLLGAPLGDADSRPSAGPVLCPGSIVRLDLETDPLTYGMPRETAGFCAFSSAFDLAAATGQRGGINCSHRSRATPRATCSRAAGWKANSAIAGKGAMAEVKSGQGRAILFAFRPQHRAQSHATFRLLFNAIHTSK